MSSAKRALLNTLDNLSYGNMKKIGDQPIFFFFRSIDTNYFFAYNKINIL